MTVTVLTHNRCLLAKRWKADGTIAPYDDAQQFKVRSEKVESIDELSALLTRLEGDPHSAIIRGEYRGDEVASADPKYKPGFVRKTKANFDDLPRHWVLIEVDKWATELTGEKAVEAYVRRCLPAEFADASYHWQLSSSAGHAGSAGVLKAHIWFWLAKPASSAALKAWAAAQKIPVDVSVFNPVQVHYTAAPIADPGVVIPVEKRSGFVQGLFSDEVELDLGSAELPGTTQRWDISDADLLGLGNEPLGWSVEQAREILSKLDANCSREEWIKVLAAIHHEFRGSDDGLDLVDEWSAGASNYGGRADVEGRWSSFGQYRGGAQITGRYLLKAKNEVVVHEKYDAVREWKEQLAEATAEYEIRERLCKEIVKDDRVDVIGREALAAALKEAFGRLGNKYPIDVCRKLIAPVKQKRREFDPEKDTPEWLRGWVYVTSDDKFYRKDSDEWLTAQGFNAKYTRFMEPDENGYRPMASRVALDTMGLATVTHAMYLPWAGPEFEHDGIRYVNTYRPSSVPVAVDDLSGAGRRAVAVVMRHLRLICNQRGEVVQTMLDWLAHQVQKPGVKVRWAPLIKGVEGDGKSVLGELLASVMGRCNVKNVSPKVLGTDFTGWAQGAAVITLEEIKLTGHNRYDILNALKPFITNNSIEIHAKGKDSFDAVNTTNYMGFTNWPDALPINDTDRRWWIVFTPWANSVEFAALVGPGAARVVLGNYFDELNDVIVKQSAELRRWLLDHKISDSFRPNGAAPVTDEKKVMIAMSVSDEEMDIKDILEKGGPGITPTLFAASYMTAALKARHPELATTSLNRLYARCGFAKFSKKVWWREKAHNVWMKGCVNIDETYIRSALNNTPKEDDLF